MISRRWKEFINFTYLGFDAV